MRDGLPAQGLDCLVEGGRPDELQLGVRWPGLACRLELVCGDEEHADVGLRSRQHLLGHAPDGLHGSGGADAPGARDTPTPREVHVGRLVEHRQGDHQSGARTTDAPRRHVDGNRQVRLPRSCLNAHAQAGFLASGHGSQLDVRAPLGVVSAVGHRHRAARRLDCFDELVAAAH